MIVYAIIATAKAIAIVENPADRLSAPPVNTGPAPAPVPEGPAKTLPDAEELRVGVGMTGFEV